MDTRAKQHIDLFPTFTGRLWALLIGCLIIAGACGDISALGMHRAEEANAHENALLFDECNGFDDDDDGIVDEDCYCNVGETQVCVNVSEAGQGVDGVQSCVTEESAEFGRWGDCNGVDSSAADVQDEAHNILGARPVGAVDRAS